MIPTTAGTGSEVTSTAIFAARDGRKLWAWGDALRPDLAILDPTLCLDLPASLTVATGLDALVHAIEVCTAKRRDTTTSAWADDAIRRVVRSLPMAIATPQDVEVRLDLQIAACVAGACIENCGTGVAHALGHALETVAKVHHGRGVALSLDAAISWNAVGHASAYSAITSALGGSRSAASALASFIDRVGLDRQISINQGQIDEIVTVTFARENTPMRTNNLRRPTRQAVRRFVENMAGQS